MPTVRPVSELQRNFKKVVDECERSSDPIYLTRNGSASLVVMDAAAFDREMAIHERVRIGRSGCRSPSNAATRTTSQDATYPWTRPWTRLTRQGTSDGGRQGRGRHQEAQYQLVRIPSNADYNEVKRMLRALGIIADAGSVYDPAYEAAKPPVECRVVYAGHYGIYYTSEDPGSPVVVFAIEDQRRNPKTRFS